MFFDRLLKLQTLKFRLLGSTSFAQVYSAERLPLRKFRKEGASLTPLIAGLLAACGGGGGGVVPVGSGSGATPQAKPKTTFDITGSEIKGATLYLDVDGDGVLSDDEKQNALGTSNAEGEVEIDNDELLRLFGDDNELSLIADLEGATNLTTGDEYAAGDYQHTRITKSAVGGLQVLSSVTTIFEKLVAMGLDADDALDAIFGEDIDVTEEDLDDPSLYTALPSGVDTASGSQLEKQHVISVTAKVISELIEEIEASTAISETGVDKLAELLEKEIVTIQPKETGNDLVTVATTDKDGAAVDTTAIDVVVAAARTSAEADIRREQETQKGVPVAIADEVSLDEGTGTGATNHTTVTGNVITNDQNTIGDKTHNVTGVAVGDVASTSGSVGTAITGTYGNDVIRGTFGTNYLKGGEGADSFVLELRDTHIANDIVLDFKRDVQQEQISAQPGEISGRAIDKGDKIRLELSMRTDGRTDDITTLGQVKTAFSLDFILETSKSEVTIVKAKPGVFGGTPVMTIEGLSTSLVFDDFEFTMNGELL